jgi:hypothetical protein
MSSSHQSTQPHGSTLNNQTTGGKRPVPTEDHGSTKATHGSTTSAATDQAAIDPHHDNISSKTTGVNGEQIGWALKKWEKQTPQDEPWNPISGRKA